MEDSDEILINILTRTSNRPNGFYKCYTSIKQQSYKNVRHIVAYDNKSDLIYLEKLDVDKIYVGEKYNNKEYGEVDNEGNTQAIYNLYCNDLLDEVKNGWVLFLDDDNYLYHNKIVEEIIKIIKIEKSNNFTLIGQMRYPEGILLPSNLLIKNNIIKRFNIDSSCFLFHSKFKNEARWDGFKVSDFRFLKVLQEKIKNTIFVKKVFVQVNNFGDLGAKNDISFNERILNYTFNKSFFWYIIPKSHFDLFGILIFQKSTYKSFQEKSQKLLRRLIKYIKSAI